jgi:uncharacterized iron-regulated protein
MGGSFNQTRQRFEQRTLALTIFLLLVVFSFLLSASDEDKSLTLPLGQARYRGKFLDIGTGQLFSARKGKPISYNQMIEEMKKVQFVYVGETHDDLEMHGWQFRIIQELYSRDPNLAIGLEMVTVDLQPVLDDWVSGKLDEDSFLRQIRWFITWNFNYGYYKKIFDFAREKGIPVFALNAPRQLINRVRMQGYEALSEEQKKIIPPLELDNQEHRLLIKTIFESEEIPPQMKGTNLEAMFEGLYRAQVAWDETMGLNTIKAAQTTGRRVVVLAGSGHMLYNLGLNFRAHRLSQKPFATVVGVHVSENSRLRVSRGLADYIYGVKEKPYPFYPAPGLSLKKVEGLSNLVVSSDPTESLAKRAGFIKGDVILQVEDRTFDNLNELRIFLSKFDWGSEVKFKVLRNGEVVSLTLKLDPEFKASEKPH